MSTLNDAFKIERIQPLIDCNELPEWSLSAIQALKTNCALDDWGVFIALQLFGAYSKGKSSLLWKEFECIKQSGHWRNIFSIENIEYFLSTMNDQSAKNKDFCTDQSNGSALFFFTKERIGFCSFWKTQREIFEKIFCPTELSPLPMLSNPSQDGAYDSEKLLDQLLQQKILFLCGGPGSGKSTLISKIVRSYSKRFPEKIPGIRLIAPTARAAQRMQTLLTTQFDQTFFQKDWPMPTTVHQLIGLHSGDEQCTLKPRILEVTMVIVDEASMLSNELLKNILKQMPQNALILLVGDGQQLPSIELGGVFQSVHELSSSKNKWTWPKKINRHVWTLEKTHRFLDKTILSTAIAAIRENKFLSKMAALEQADDSFLWIKDVSLNAIFSIIQENYRDYFEALTHDFERADHWWHCFSTFRILTAKNEGEYGTKALNQCVISLLNERVWSKQPHRGKGYGIAWMVLKNLKKYALSNGQIGLSCAHEQGAMTQSHRLWFSENCQRFEEMLTLAHFKPEEISPAFAMTVHKAQGSEFDQVLLIISPDSDQMLSREWLYTALTRSKKRTILMASPIVLEKIINKTESCHSFFHELLLKYCHS